MPTEDLELDDSPQEEQAESQDEKEQEQLDDLPEELRQALKDLWLKCTSEGIFADREEVRDIRQAEFYWSGKQYIWWSTSQNQWNQLPTQGGSFGDNDDLDDMPRFQYVTNIYQSKGLGFIAAVAGTPPRIRFYPEDAEDGDDLSTAEGYTKLTKIIESWNPPKKLLQQESYYCWTGGIVGGYVRYVADSEQYGTEEVEKLESGESQLTPETVHCPKCGWEAPAENFVPPVPCPQCGQTLTEENLAEAQTAPAAIEAGTEELAKGREVITIVGGLNLKRPQWTNNQSEFHYLCYEREVHYAKARAANPIIADKIQGGITGGADETYRRLARLSVAQGTSLPTQTGDALANLVTMSSVWFRKAAFWMLDDKKKRDALLEKFPDGCRAEFAGNEYAGAREENMDDHWVIYHALPGVGQHRSAVGTSMLSVQDRYNTMTNISVETYEYGIPITYRASDTWDTEANEEQTSEPGSEQPVSLKTGEDIRSRIMTTRCDSVSPDMYKYQNDLIGPIAEEISGVVPALVGGSQENIKTASGYAQARDQAMGRMGIIYAQMRQFHADIFTLACDDYKDNTTGKVSKSIRTKSGDFEAESVDITALKGKAKAEPEGDENFPESWTQKRAVFMQLGDSPVFQPVLDEPDNQELARELIGIPELVLPGAEPRNKMIKTIKFLTKVEPGQLQSQPLQAEIDPEFDDNPAEITAGKNWVNKGDGGQKCKVENVQGFENVKAHLKMRMQLEAQKAAQAAAQAQLLAGQPGNGPQAGPPAKPMPGAPPNA